MKCPACCCSDNRVIDTRRYDETVVRVRECQRCGHCWRTYEMAETAITVINPIFPTPTSNN